MLSSLLLSPLAPPKQLHFDPINLPISTNRILIRRVKSKKELGEKFWKFRASDHKNMTEFVEADVFERNDGYEEEAKVTKPESLSLTIGQKLNFVEFDATLNRLSKWLVAALFGILILWKHDAEALWVAMGSVVNSCLSIKLKKLLNHERPATALRSDPGMPSSHAQSIFYTAFFAVLSLFQWLGTNAYTVGAGSVILMCGTYLTWLRVSQRLHTVSQVVVGAVLGSVCSITWFWLWHAFVFEAFTDSIFVRFFVVFGSLSFCSAFLLYVIQNWLDDDR